MNGVEKKKRKHKRPLAKGGKFKGLKAIQAPRKPKTTMKGGRKKPDFFHTAFGDRRPTKPEPDDMPKSTPKNTTRLHKAREKRLAGLSI